MQQKPTEIFLQIIKNFYEKYKNWIIGIGTGVIISVLLVVIMIYRIKQTKEYVSQRLLVAESYIYQKNFNEVYKILDEIINHYKNSKHAGYAMFLKANVLYDNKDFVQAKQVCIDFLKIKKPKSVVVPMMYILGQSYLALNDFDNAINVFNEITQKYVEHYYTPRVYESLTFCYELKGDTQSARSIYEKMNILYPNSYWSNIAQQKLANK
jgi:TolA-binding protein